MTVNNNPYFNFKSYKQYIKPITKPNKPNYKIKPKALIGSAVGVASTALVLSKVPKKQTKPDEIMRMLSMAGMANIGGILAGSFGADNKTRVKKYKEAAFQMMNTTIPMVMVGSAISICEKFKALNKNSTKAIGSIGAMILGAATATKITNLFKKDNEPKRKYTIRDSVANFDDIVATIKLGFKNVEKYVPVDKILPFIYIYSGSRSGSKE